MLETLERFAKWSIANNAEIKILVVIGIIVAVALSIQFYRKVLKEN